MNRYGAVLDDFGFETMLEKLMEGFICPISRGIYFYPSWDSSWKIRHRIDGLALWFRLIFLWFVFVVFFPEVGGSTLDSHHGFVVEYGVNRDVELGRFLP